MDYRDLLSHCDGIARRLRKLPIRCFEFSTSLRKLDSVQIVKI